MKAMGPPTSEAQDREASERRKENELRRKEDQRRREAERATRELKRNSNEMDRPSTGEQSTEDTLHGGAPKQMGAWRRRGCFII
eukprot:SAG22_NODE_119_length_19257_cov_43.260413_21_plen_84_part_00